MWIFLAIEWFSIFIYLIICYIHKDAHSTGFCSKRIFNILIFFIMWNNIISMHTHLKVIETNKEKHPLRMPSPPKQLSWLVWQLCFPTSFPCVMHTSGHRQWCKSLLYHRCAFAPYPIFLLVVYFHPFLSSLSARPAQSLPPTLGPVGLSSSGPRPHPHLPSHRCTSGVRGGASLTSPCQHLTFLTKTITSSKISLI